MSIVRSASAWFLIANWILFGGLLAWNHVRVRTTRRRLRIAEEKPSMRDPRSMHGLVLEGLSFVIAFWFTAEESGVADWRRALSMGCGCGSVALLGWALKHLGLEWRIKAVVTDDHRLITSGPYSIMRHPVFAALSLLLLATVALMTTAWAALLAIGICAWGTAIRIRAEDGLLGRRFGSQYEQYRKSTAAVIPMVR